MRLLSASLCLLVLVCVLPPPTDSTKTDDFNKVLDDLNTVLTTAKTSYNTFASKLYPKKNEVKDYYWKTLDVNLLSLRGEFNTAISDFKNQDLRPQTNASTPEVLARVNEIADDTTAPYTEAADERKDGFLQYSQVEGQKLLDLFSQADSKLQTLEAKDLEIAALETQVKNTVIEDSEVKKLRQTLHLITRQIQNMQFNEEEKTRSDGNSGIKQIRTRYGKSVINFKQKW